MPFAATWKDLEIIILRERQIYDITYMWNLYYTNELTYKTETDMGNKLWLPKGREGGGSLGLADTNDYTQNRYKLQGPTV